MKKVLITGVSSGIGKATAKLFHEEGWYVIGIALEKNILMDNVDYYISTDISKIGNIKHLFNEIYNITKHIDVLINNAGIQIHKSLINTSTFEWNTTIDTNLRSMFFSIKYAYPLMKTYGGSIVNISSVHAIVTSQNIAAYSISKGAILSLTKSTAIELASNNIRVNSILPGAIDTPMLRESFKHINNQNENDDHFEKIKERTVIKRIGTVEEVAQAILFLSDNLRSSFITGQSLVVDGGASIKLSTE